ncbi:MAG: hypothetical protein HOD03_03755 [Planctomycetes bacterium]|jgi:hypothetical protein|nr:hypothetical protein [Planctomycetota bacterium]
MRKIAYCGATTLLVFAACSAPDPQTVPMVKMQPAIAATTAVTVNLEAPVSQTIDIAISGMS